MLRSGRTPEGVELACSRLDGLVRLAGPELGRWMVAVAERCAADSCRTQGSKTEKPRRQSACAGARP